jgi:hypothetical protein
VDLRSDVLETRVGGTARDSDLDPLSINEMRELRSAVEPTASALGYGGPSRG